MNINASNVNVVNSKSSHNAEAYKGRRVDPLLIKKIFETGVRGSVFLVIKEDAIIQYYFFISKVRGVVCI